MYCSPFSRKLHSNVRIVAKLLPKKVFFFILSANRRVYPQFSVDSEALHSPTPNQRNYVCFRRRLDMPVLLLTSASMPFSTPSSIFVQAFSVVLIDFSDKAKIMLSSPTIRFS